MSAPVASGSVGRGPLSHTRKRTASPSASSHGAAPEPQDGSSKEADVWGLTTYQYIYLNKWYTDIHMVYVYIYIYTSIICIWMDGWRDGWDRRDGRVDGWTDGFMGGWVMGGWVGGWMDGWMHGWMDGWINGLIDR